MTPTALFSEKVKGTDISFEQQRRRLNVMAGISPLTGIMGHIGSCVKKPVDAMAAVAPHNGETIGLSVLLDDVS